MQAGLGLIALVFSPCAQSLTRLPGDDLRIIEISRVSLVNHAHVL